MRYGEAFSKLGYKLKSPRTDWSAANENGVCVTLWRDEIDWKSQPISMDSRVRGGRLEDWESKPGNKKRRMHLQSALDNHEGWIDAIIVDGSSETGVEKASIWIPRDRDGLRWRITYFDPKSGHVALEAL